MVAFSSFVAFAGALASVAEARPTRQAKFNVDFSTYNGGSVTDFLNANRLSVSNYTVGSTPLPHTFTPDNVDIVNGALRLKVTGGSINSAEIATKFTMLYANITTRAKISKVPGTCASTFFYKNDNQEIDIEMLSSYITTGSQDGAVPAGLEFTNQAVKPGGTETNKAVPYGFDPTAGFHDYTIVWTNRMTRFYTDGQLRATLTTNVPTQAGPWVWNNWSSGDPYWSAGPPTSDNFYEIQSIVGTYTYS
ncbi:concanavalin A-like lectin/glucanase [Meredithblackwellia eburnea MCA 4105]